MHRTPGDMSHESPVPRQFAVEEALARKYRAGRCDGGEEDWRTICEAAGTDIHTIRELACKAA